jgi:hypothetical protein
MFKHAISYIIVEIHIIYQEGSVSKRGREMGAESLDLQVQQWAATDLIRYDIK